MSRLGLGDLGLSGCVAPEPEAWDAAGGENVVAVLDAQLAELARARALVGPRGWVDADLALCLAEAGEEVANRLLDLSEAMSRHARDLRRRTPQSANSNLKPSS